MKLITQGAEAKIFYVTHLQTKIIIKRRDTKKYREKKLDEKISKERIRTECNLILKAQKIGVRTPLIKGINLKKKEILFEFISGKTLKETLFGENKKEKLFCEIAGQKIGKLHSNKIIHGDLTSSNILIHNNCLVFIDFGLGTISSKIEDFAVDLLVFKKTFKATHYKKENLWKEIERGYKKEFNKWKQTIKQMKVVEARVRYF